MFLGIWCCLTYVFVVTSKYATWWQFVNIKFRFTFLHNQKLAKAPIALLQWCLYRVPNVPIKADWTTQQLATLSNEQYSKRRKRRYVELRSTGAVSELHVCHCSWMWKVWFIKKTSEWPWVNVIPLHIWTCIMLITHHQGTTVTARRLFPWERNSVESTPSNQTGFLHSKWARWS